MKKIILIMSLLILACSHEQEIVEVTKIFSMEDVSSAGFKVKKDFNTEFPDATDAKWGFYKGRDVGVIRYATLELAKTSGEIAGKEQTEQIEVVEKNIAHGPKVERTECRGHKSNQKRGCVRREPMYTEFKIHGNLIILMEPLATEDQNDTIKFLNKAVSSIK